MERELNSQQIEYRNGMELLIGYIDRESTSAQSMLPCVWVTLRLKKRDINVVKRGQQTKYIFSTPHPLRPLTNIRIYVKTPLGCNWYPRPGVI
jgi:hypothetical protein